jgi:hypothetical protein
MAISLLQGNNTSLVPFSRKMHGKSFAVRFREKRTAKALPCNF